MLVLGLILILIAVALLLAAFLGGSDSPVSFDLGLFGLETNTLGAFLLGAVTTLLLVVGLEVARIGARTAKRRRQERRELDERSQRLDERESAQRGGSATDPE